MNIHGSPEDLKVLADFFAGCAADEARGKPARISSNLGGAPSMAKALIVAAGVSMGLPAFADASSRPTQDAISGINTTREGVQDGVYQLRNFQSGQQALQRHDIVGALSNAAYALVGVDKYARKILPTAPGSSPDAGFYPSLHAPPPLHSAGGAPVHAPAQHGHAQSSSRDEESLDDLGPR